MDDTRSGRGEFRCAGTLFSTSRPCPLSRPKRLLRAMLGKNKGVRGLVTDGLKKSISSFLSLMEYPEKFMKTKELGNAVDDPMFKREECLRPRIHSSTSWPVSRVPCPLSRVPLYKNEGASGDVDENKGTGKFQGRGKPSPAPATRGCPPIRLTHGPCRLSMKDCRFLEILHCRTQGDDRPHYGSGRAPAQPEKHQR
jgi:hypothetical protein